MNYSKLMYEWFGDYKRPTKVEVVISYENVNKQTLMEETKYMTEQDLPFLSGIVFKRKQFDYYEVTRKLTKEFIKTRPDYTKDKLEAARQQQILALKDGHIITGEHIIICSVTVSVQEDDWIDIPYEEYLEYKGVTPRE